MDKRRRLIIGSAVAIALILFIISYYVFNKAGNESWNYDQMVDFYSEEEIRLTSQDRLEIAAVIENINIFEGEEGMLKAVLHGEVPENYRNLPKLKINSRGKRIIAEARYRKDKIDLRKGSLVLDIYLPHSYSRELIIDTYSGDISLNNRKNKFITVNTVSGAISALQIECDNFVCQSVSGNISLEEVICFNILDARSTSGEVDMQNIDTRSVQSASVSGNLRFKGNSGQVTAETVSGPMDIYLGNLKDDISLIGVSGDISLYINPSAAFDLDANTVTGEISLQGFDLSSGKTREDKLQGKINGGGNDVSISTTSGNILIDRYMN